MSDLTAFFGRYAASYMASDVDAVSAMYEVPTLAVREGRAVHLSDDATLRSHLAGLMDAYRSSGAARADIADIEQLSLGQSGAMVTVRWHVVDSSGALLKDFRTTYQVLRTDGSWRILSYTNHD